MVALWLFIALAFPDSHQNIPTPENQASIQRQATLNNERHQAVIQMNELAGRIRSDADAVALVDGIADTLADILPPTLVSQVLRRRVAHAEYEAVSDPLRRIPEQRIADVWNEYVRNIGAPEEAFVTVAEIHNLRDASYAGGQLMWTRGINQSIWTMPNIFEVDPDGKIADSCRAVEALRIIYDLDMLFDNLRGARARLQKGIIASDELRKHQEATNANEKSASRLEVDRITTNPVHPAEVHYIREYGLNSFNQLLERSFDELFPVNE